MVFPDHFGKFCANNYVWIYENRVKDLWVCFFENRSVFSIAFNLVIYRRIFLIRILLSLGYEFKL